MSLRIVFMGTPEFAVASLDCLLRNNFNVVAVVTSPDKPAGRGQQLQQSAVKNYALKHNLKILQPEKLKDVDFVNELQNLKADLQFVVAFRMLPEIVWNMPRLGTYNLHASLLPKYRGAAPINWAIINGDSESGVTTFKLKHEIDTGKILFQEKVFIDSEMNAGDLHDKLMEIGADLILKTAVTIFESEQSGKPLNYLMQKDEFSSHAPKIYKDDCKINWSKSAQEINNLIRGLSPYPAAFTEIKNDANSIQVIKIFKSKVEFVNVEKTNGTLITDNKNFLKVCCTDGLINVLEIQLQGKKRMTIQEFLRGYKINEATKFI